MKAKFLALFKPKLLKPLASGLVCGLIRPSTKQIQCYIESPAKLLFRKMHAQSGLFLTYYSVHVHVYANRHCVLHMYMYMYIHVTSLF